MFQKMVAESLPSETQHELATALTGTAFFDWIQAEKAEITLRLQTAGLGTSDESALAILRECATKTQMLDETEDSFQRFVTNYNATYGTIAEE